MRIERYVVCFYLRKCRFLSVTLSIFLILKKKKKIAVMACQLNFVKN